MYAEELSHFKNAKNLGGKAWEHAKVCDLIQNAGIDDCSMHCFHYQKMFELLFKHLLETKTEYGAYPMIHKLDKLFYQTIEQTCFSESYEKYASTLNALTVCAKMYRYGNCKILCVTVYDKTQKGVIYDKQRRTRGVCEKSSQKYQNRKRFE